MRTYDVIVVGGGHAGCEAALASARMGFETLLLPINIETIGHMPCNCSIGGPAKGHLVREIDALGGEQALATDATYTHIRMLNTGKGPAVRAIRAQVDKRLYEAYMRRTLMNQPGASVDWFGAESSGMNITLSDTGGSSIQNVTGGYGTTLTGTYQADQTLGTFNNSLANGTWEIYFASQESGGGNAVLNSYTLNIEIIPEPVNVALVIFLVVLLVGTGFRRVARAKAGVHCCERSGETV